VTGQPIYMKRLPSVAFFFSAVAGAAAQIVGINYNNTSLHNQYLCINPTSGNVTVLSTFDFDSGYYFGNSFTTDVTLGRAYAVSSVGTLYTFDLATGVIQQSPVPLGISVIRRGLPGQLVGIKTLSSGYGFCSIDPATGNSTLLTTFTLAAGFVADNFVTDLATGVAGTLGTAYLLGSDQKLYTFNMTTGMLLGNPQLSAGVALIDMGLSGNLIGIYYPSGGSWDLRSINPATGNETPLSSVALLSGINQSTFKSSPATNTVYVASGFPYQLYTFNLSTGALLPSPNLSMSVQTIGIGTGLCPQPICQSYTITTLAGLAGAPGWVDATGNTARFNTPPGVTVDVAGNVYVADGGNHRIRMVTAGGTVTTVAGTGVAGFLDGPVAAANFRYPSGVAVDSTGTVLYVADTDNNRIRKIAGGQVTTFAGTGAPGNVIGPALAARFDSPKAVALDSTGNVYVADTSNNEVKKISGGMVSRLGLAAGFNHPSGVAVDGFGTVYVANTGNHTIDTITSGGSVSTLAGSSGNPGSVDGNGTAALFNLPRGVAADGAGNVFVADTINFTIREILANPSGTVCTIAGSAAAIGSADGSGSVARFGGSFGVAVNNAGKIYVADTDNHTIRAGVASVPAPRPPRRRNLIMLTATGVILLAAAGFFLLWRRRSQQSQN
jgi:DNA-binding beta-propeller fold protein YncE